MDLYHFTDLLTYLSPVGLLLGIAIGLYKFQSLDAAHKLLIPYLVAALITDILSRTIVPHYGKSNLILLPLFSLVEIGLFTILYVRFFDGYKRIFVWLTGSSITTIYLLVLYSIFKGSTINLSSFTNVASSLGVATFALLFFFDRLKHMKHINWSLFSLNGVVLIYFSLKLIFYIPLYFFISVSSDVKFYFWLLYLMITIAFYGFLIKALWKNGRIAS